MGNLKNRWVRPGGAFNYTEGVRVCAAEDIVKDAILVITGVSGEIGLVSLANCDSDRTCDGRLLVAKHDIPADGYGVALPWKIVTNYDTTSDPQGVQTVGFYGDHWIVGSAAFGPGGPGTLARIDGQVGQSIVTAGAPFTVRIMAKTLQPSSGVDVADGAILISVDSPL